LRPATADQRRWRLAVVHDLTLEQVRRGELDALQCQIRHVTRRINDLVQQQEQLEQEEPNQGQPPLRASLPHLLDYHRMEDYCRDENEKDSTELVSSSTALPLPHRQKSRDELDASSGSSSSFSDSSNDSVCAGAVIEWRRNRRAVPSRKDDISTPSPPGSPVPWFAPVPMLMSTKTPVGKADNATSTEPCQQCPRKPAPLATSKQQRQRSDDWKRRLKATVGALPLSFSMSDEDDSESGIVVERVDEMDALRGEDDDDVGQGNRFNCTGPFGDQPGKIDGNCVLSSKNFLRSSVGFANDDLLLRHADDAFSKEKKSSTATSTATATKARRGVDHNGNARVPLQRHVAQRNLRGYDHSNET